MAKKYVIANWKMNPQSVAEAEDLLNYIDEHLQNSTDKKEQSLVICPPFVFLDDISKILKTSRLGRYAELGAQDIALSDSGAWTGEISAPMLCRLGARYVIIGHSERRWKIGESDEIVNKKLKTTLANELIPIVCIGERERGENYKDFLKTQIDATFASLSKDEIGKCLITYEPVWAISTNPNSRPDKPEDTLEAITVIKEVLGSDTKVLYGGSVTEKNAEDFLSLQEISGVLVGGASIRKEEFVQILKMV